MPSKTSPRDALWLREVSRSPRYFYPPIYNPSVSSSLQPNLLTSYRTYVNIVV
jgi:hypothetical protein